MSYEYEPEHTTIEVVCIRSDYDAEDGVKAGNIFNVNISIGYGQDDCDYHIENVDMTNIEHNFHIDYEVYIEDKFIVAPSEYRKIDGSYNVLAVLCDAGFTDEDLFAYKLAGNIVPSERLEELNKEFEKTLKAIDMN